MIDYKKKFKVYEDGQVEYFVNNGYLIYKDVFTKEFIVNSKDFFFENLNKLIDLSKSKKIDYDINGIAAAIIDKYAMSNLYQEYIDNKNLKNIMQTFLGKDLAIFDKDALWINTPSNKDPVLNKGIHTDAWTGTSVNTLFCKTLFTDVDSYNSMTVCPGSHLYGLTPVKNRSIDENIMNMDHIKEVNLDHLEAGDVLVWHALLLHGTTGQSDKNTRVSVTSRFTSTETGFSSQERSLGYKAISVSPLNQILRLIGSDTLQPLRTYGGYVGIDRRLEKLYGYSSYNSDEDYSKYIK